MLLNEVNKTLLKIFDEIILAFVFSLSPVFFLCCSAPLGFPSSLVFLCFVLLILLPQIICLIQIVKSEIALEGGQLGDRNYQKDLKRRNHLIELTQLFMK